VQMLLKQDYSKRDWPIKTHYFEVWYDILLENLVKLCSVSTESYIISPLSTQQGIQQKF